MRTMSQTLCLGKREKKRFFGNGHFTGTPLTELDNTETIDPPLAKRLTNLGDQHAV